LFKKFQNKEAEKILGDVLVTKNPCSHPGDIRKLKAVWKEELKHLVNVVVFSCKGIRPEQNKMSGGDLDGDSYMIIWDEDLVKDFQNFPAAVYKK
jgi:RNA-dependent RNA polymerase